MVPIFMVPFFYWEFHNEFLNPKWRTPSFFRGVEPVEKTTNQDARAVAGHPARLRNGDEVQEFDEMLLGGVKS